MKRAAKLLYNTEADVEIIEVSDHFVSKEEILHHAKLRIVTHKPATENFSDPNSNTYKYTTARSSGALERIPIDVLQAKLAAGPCPFSGDSSEREDESELESNTCPGERHLELKFRVQYPNIPTECLQRLLPYHLVFNDRLVILQCGAKVYKISPLLQEGANLRDVTEITYPRIPYTFRDILVFSGFKFSVRVYQNSQGDTQEMFLKGK